MKEAGLKALESATTSITTSTTTTTTVLGVGGSGEGGDNKRQKTATAGGVNAAAAAASVPTVDINKLLGPPVPARPVPTAAALLAEAHAINARIHEMVAGRLPHLNANNLYNRQHIPPHPLGVIRPQARHIAPAQPAPAAAAAIPIRGGFVGPNNLMQLRQNPADYIGNPPAYNPPVMPTLAPAAAHRRGAPGPAMPPPTSRAIVPGRTAPLIPAVQRPWIPGDDEVQIIDPPLRGGPPNNTGNNYDPGNIGRKRKQD